jgi:phosphate transport system substrate-binding protein
VRVTVGTSGTGGGFEKFCKGEIDLSDASREIKPEEAAACEAGGVEYSKFQVANDGIAVVASVENDWVDCLTVAQLKKIWDDGSTVKTWKDVDPKFPAEKIDLYGPGTDSGTFDFFTKAINGVEDQSRSDYSATENDNQTVGGVSGSKGGLGYFGLSYFEENQDKLKLLGVDGGKGCVTPDTKTVQSGTYAPLSRPLFIYPSKDLLARSEGIAFVEFYLGNTSEITKQALFVDLNAAQLATAKKGLAALKALQ